MNKIVISDTSCLIALIALDRINQLKIFQKVFITILTTPEVQSEFGRQLPLWIQIHNANDVNKKKELERLVDKGEASAIALALETQNSVLIIDEKKGRKLAKGLQLEIVGTLKVLLLAKQKRVIAKIFLLIVKLEQQNFRFNKTLLNDILMEAGENR